LASPSASSRVSFASAAAYFAMSAVNLPAMRSAPFSPCRSIACLRSLQAGEHALIPLCALHQRRILRAPPSAVPLLPPSAASAPPALAPASRVPPFHSVTRACSSLAVIVFSRARRSISASMRLPRGQCLHPSGRNLCLICSLYGPFPRAGCRISAASAPGRRSSSAASSHTCDWCAYHFIDFSVSFVLVVVFLRLFQPFPSWIVRRFHLLRCLVLLSSPGSANRVLICSRTSDSPRSSTSVSSRARRCRPTLRRRRPAYLPARWRATVFVPRLPDIRFQSAQKSP